MNRRGFLASLGIGAAAFALDPERALWVPGAKTISVPAVPDFEELFRERYFRPAAMAIHQKMLAEYNAHITLMMERGLLNIRCRVSAGSAVALSDRSHGLGKRKNQRVAVVGARDVASSH